MDCAPDKDTHDQDKRKVYKLVLIDVALTMFGMRLSHIHAWYESFWHRHDRSVMPFNRVYNLNFSPLCKNAKPL